MFFAIGMSLFFVNKGFNFCMIIDFDKIFYESTRERFFVVKAKNIIDIMKNILKLLKSNLQRFKQVITAQVNKHRKLMRYSFGDKIWLSSNNIIIVRPFRKLKNKMLESFEIVKFINIFYRLKLSFFIKVHFVFHISLLRSDSNNPLSNQIIDAFRSMKIENGDEWLMNEILDFRRHHNRLQYKVK